MIYRTLILLSFIGVNGLLLFGISQTLSFLNTGADRSGMLHIGVKNKQAYMPKVNWKDTINPGRPIEKQTIFEIQKDYVNSWYVKNVAYKDYDSLGVFDFFTESARENVVKTMLFNQSHNTKVSQTTISHNLYLDFYSADGQLVVFEDRDMKSYSQIQQDDLMRTENFDSESYKVVMLLEDGFWRVRHMVRQDQEQDTIAVKKSSYIKGDKLYVDNEEFELQGINYYPKDSPWDMFGDTFDLQIIEKDFKLITSIGLNTIRIFVPYEDFGKEKVVQEKLTKLKKVLQLAAQENLKVVVTLFDFYGNYALEDWTFTHRHAEQIVTALKDDKALLMWDIKNEPDLDFESRDKTTVLAWLKEMMRQIRQIDSIHPVTIGWSSIEGAMHLKNDVDIVSFHYYKDLIDFNTSYQILAPLNKPKVLQEYGISSYQGFWAPFGSSKEDQAEYHRAFQQLIKANKLHFMSWTLYDFNEVPSGVVGRLPWRKNKQKHFGFIDQEGKKKPSFQYIK